MICARLDETFGAGRNSALSSIPSTCSTRALVSTSRCTRAWSADDVSSTRAPECVNAYSTWRGRSALDAAVLMDVGWNFRREHLRPEQRSQMIYSDGGDQPNVVPSRAGAWYFIREIEYSGIQQNFETAIQIAEGAAMMTDTEMEYRILGAAWPRHFNRPIAELMQRHIERVGLPEWSEADQQLARGSFLRLFDAGAEVLEVLVFEFEPLITCLLTSGTCHKQHAAYGPCHHLFHCFCFC